MNKPPTLNELRHLQESGFGRTYPSHGLKLLYWFAHDCLYFDTYNHMCWQYDPEDGDFGFHRFQNRCDKFGNRLLPDVDLNYHEVGNLNRAGAEELPNYLREDYIQNHKQCNSNKDRIIVSVDEECFEKVYVTEHIDSSEFNREATYCISRGLIMVIRRMELQDFLTKTGYSTLLEESDQSSTEEDEDDDDDDYDNDDYDVKHIKKIELPPNLMKNKIQAHHDASPTPSIFSSLISHLHITSSSTQNSSTLPKSNSICPHNKTQMHTTAAEGETNICGQDNTIQTSSDSNLQTPSNDIPPTSTWTAAIMSPFSQMNYSFCLVLLLFWVFFFFFIWGNVMQLFILIIFVVLISTAQTSRDSNLQTLLNDIPPTSTWTAAVKSPFSQMNYSFCLVLLLFWVFFFSFIWGDVMRLFILIIFVVLISTIQTSRDSNLQTPLNDIPPTFTWTVAVKSPFSQMNYSFCLVLLLFWVFFFSFLWGNVMRLFILIMFVVLILHKQRWKRGQLGKMKEREEKQSEEQKGKTFKNKTEKEKRKWRNCETTCNPIITPSSAQNTRSEPFPVSQIDTSFWWFYFLFLFIYLLGENVIQLFLLVLF